MTDLDKIGFRIKFKLIAQKASWMRDKLLECRALLDMRP